MTATSHVEMHGEHRAWTSEIGLWRDDLRAWQAEVVKAKSELKQLETALEKHEDALRKHASAIRLHEQDASTHEHLLAEYEKGAQGQELIQLAQQHNAEAARQAQQRDAHERLKRHHHSAMALWSLLLKALGQS